MKPLIKYRGGKSREIPHIEPYIPRYTGRYIEPFFGGGALFFYLEPRRAIINDINERLMNFYRGVRNDFARVRAELSEIERVYMANRRAFEERKRQHPEERVEDANEDMYYHLRSQYNGLEPAMFSDASLYYYINKTAYSGMIRYNANGEFNVPYGRYPRINTENVTSEHSRLLQRAELFSVDYSEIFALCEPDDFVFLDPPYDCIFSDYGNQEYQDGFSENEHRSLADAFYALPCRALMVIGRTPLTEKLYGNDIVDEYGKNYAVNIRNRFRSAASHIVVANYRRNLDAVPDYNAMPNPYAVVERAVPMLFEDRENHG